jgi:hypothetical protein
MSINISLYSSQGKSGGTFQTSGSKLSDIMPQINAAGINIDNMRLVVGETENELITPDSLLPSHDFTLFFYQVRNKGGASKPAYSRSDVYNAIKAIIAANKATKEDFTIDGKNFTMVPTDKLVQAMLTIVSEDELSKYLSGFGSTSSIAPAKIEKAVKAPAKPSKAADSKRDSMSKDLSPVLASVSVSELDMTSKARLSTIINELSSIFIPDNHQKSFYEAVASLTFISANWETKKVDPKELANKYNKIGSNLKNVKM